MTVGNPGKSPSALYIAALEDVEWLPANFTNVPRWERQTRCMRLTQTAVLKHTQIDCKAMCS